MIYCCIFQNWRPPRRGHHSTDSLNGGGRRKLPPLYPFPTPTLNDILLYISELETVKKGTPLYGQPEWWGEEETDLNIGINDLKFLNILLGNCQV